MRRILPCSVMLALCVLAWPLRGLDQSAAATYPWATVEVESDSGGGSVFSPILAKDSVYYALQSWRDSKKACNLQELTKPTPDMAKIKAQFVIERAGTKTEVNLSLPIVPKSEAKWTRLDDHLRVKAYASDALLML